MSDIEQVVETALANAKEEVVVDTKKALADARAAYEAAEQAVLDAHRELSLALQADAARVKAEAAALKAKAKADKEAFLAKFGFVKRTIYRLIYGIVRDFTSKL